jgi:hypothetical protein
MHAVLPQSVHSTDHRLYGSIPGKGGDFLHIATVAGLDRTGFRVQPVSSSYVLSMYVTGNKQHPPKYRWIFKKRSFPFRVIFPFSVIFRSWPPLWSCGQSSWLQIERSGFDSRRYQIFLEVVCLVRGPFSLVSSIQELLGRKSSGFGLEKREYGLGIRHADHVAPCIRTSWH